MVIRAMRHYANLVSGDEDGLMDTALIIRPVCASDAPGLEAFYETLGPDARYLRFHGMSHVSRATCTTFACVDGHKNAGYVALWGSEIIGHACLTDAGPGRAELGIAVSETHTRHGIGLALLEALEDWARMHGIHRICASVLATNGPMLALMNRIGPVETLPSPYLQELELEAVLA